MVSHSPPPLPLPCHLPPDASSSSSRVQSLTAQGKAELSFLTTTTNSSFPLPIRTLLVTKAIFIVFQNKSHVNVNAYLDATRPAPLLPLPGDASRWAMHVQAG